MAIDIGAAAADYNSTNWAGLTDIDFTNPANESGTLTDFEFWANENIAGLKLGTFYGSGYDFTMRDYESIGNVTAGSKQTFTGKSCSVETGDFIGSYFTSGKEEKNTSGGSGHVWVSGDKFVSGVQTYASYEANTKSAKYGYAADATALPVFMNYYQNIMR